MRSTSAGATALYRFYDAVGQLLYVGITNNIPRRLGQHSDTKAWFHDTTNITVEHHATRTIALAAEKSAIQVEHPKYNLVHNHGRRRIEVKGGAQWTFESLRSGMQRTTDLWLMPELDYSAVLDDWGHLDGEGQLEEYADYVKSQHPEWIEENAVPILWSIAGRATFESAPFQTGGFGREANRQDFLSFYTWPWDQATGEQVNWFKLPIRHRFPEFADALGWTPAPLQPTCPLLSILAIRDGLELPYRRERNA